MKKIIRITVFLIATAMLTIALCSCSGIIDDKLVGSWYFDNGDYFVLHSDKTCRISDHGGTRGTWKQKDGFVEIILENETAVFEIIELTDDKLTISMYGEERTLYKE